MLLSATHGERILRFQALYQQYSRLELSSDYDRPTAIDGLQQRLLRTMLVQGKFGIVEDGNKVGVLRRSLLWHRSGDFGRLKRIVFPQDRERVPSWSWMSRYGGIDYFGLKWDGFEWQELQSEWPQSTRLQAHTQIIGNMHVLDWLAAKNARESLIFDDPEDAQRSEFKALVLGVEKGPIIREKKLHYILMVTSIANFDPGSEQYHERVGAGCVLGSKLGGEATRCFLI